MVPRIASLLLFLLLGLVAGCASPPDFAPLPRFNVQEEAPAEEASEAPEGTAGEEPAADDETALAKKTQNPVADLISLPFQNNMDFGVGHKNDIQNTLNIQPVAPFSVNDSWNVITRTIAPVIYKPETVPGDDSEFGLGDTNFTAFISPKDDSGFVWGVGPSITVPTATDDFLGSEKWSWGPSAVALNIDGPWVYGGLVSHVWSFAGESDRRHVSFTLIQPFVNYNFGGGWYAVSAPIITSNWASRKSGDNWLVPLGGGFGKIFRIGKMPFNAQVQAFSSVHRPKGGPEWTLRLQIQLLFPKKKSG